MTIIDGDAKLSRDAAANIDRLTGQVRDLKAQLDMATDYSKRWEECAKAFEGERDALKRDLDEEYAGSAMLRKHYGAKEDETMRMFVSRVVSERDEVHALLNDALQDRDKSSTLVSALRGCLKKECEDGAEARKRIRTLETALRAQLLEPSRWQDEDMDGNAFGPVMWICQHCGCADEDASKIEHDADCWYVIARAALTPAPATTCDCAQPNLAHSRLCINCKRPVALAPATTACPCREPKCTGVNDGANHQCGGPREACGIAGCPECKAAPATTTAHKHTMECFNVCPDKTPATTETDEEVSDRVSRLVESKWKNGTEYPLDPEEIDRLRADLAAEKKAREEAEAACAAMREALDAARKIWPVSSDETDIYMRVLKQIRSALAPDAGRALLERLRAAEADLKEERAEHQATAEAFRMEREAHAATRAERDAYRKAKQENDERFMTERDEARAALAKANERAEANWGKAFAAAQNVSSLDASLVRVEEENARLRAAMGRLYVALDRMESAYTNSEVITKALEKEVLEALEDADSKSAGEYVRELEAVYEAWVTYAKIGMLPGRETLWNLQAAAAKVAARRGRP